MTLTEEVTRKEGKKLGQQLCLADGFGFSDGWLHNFKQHYGIKSNAMHVEAGSAAQEGIDLAHKHLRAVLEEGGLRRKKFTIRTRGGCFGDRCTQELWPMASVLAARRKWNVIRFHSAAMPGTHNMSLFMIGKAARPRSFSRSFDLGVRYANNKSA
jgi:hypothetical protein